MSDVTLGSKLVSSETVRQSLELTSLTSQIVYREPPDWIAHTRGKGIISCAPPIPPDAAHAAVPTSAGPTPLPAVKPESSKPLPALGVSALSFSHSGALLAATSAATPRCVYLFAFDDDAGDGALAVALHAAAIFNEPLSARSLDWARGSRAADLLAVAYGSQAVGIYGLSSVAPTFEGIGVPASGGFAVRRAKWTADGVSLVLADHEAFCVGTPVDEPNAM